MNRKVSVVIPVYNRQEMVQECVSSILAQSYDNFEIILIDDGSTDRTLAVCHELAERDARIRVLEGQHGGISAARNIGLEAATGEFVFFVDSDDVINPHLMDALVRGMTNSGAGISGTKVVRVNEQHWHKVRERLTQPFDPGATVNQTNDQAIEAMFTGGSPLACIGGVMMRRDLIGQTRFRTDLFIGEDFFFIYENLIKGADVDFLKQNWYYVRNHENNSSWNYGYDGFYTRFLRRKLVWESEESLGRTENVKRQKREVFGIFHRHLNRQGVSKEDRRKMCCLMKQHKKELLPAYTLKKRLLYYLDVYVPFDFVRTAVSETLAYRRRQARKKAQQQQ